jgi:NAD(P)-dependent dehydrogenase (short-subunit alcohol dehydrogenase family)
MATETEVTNLVGDGAPAGASQMAAMRWAKLNPPKDVKTSFAGKTVIVTGSNTGIGLPAATKFAANGAANVILAVRSQSKGEAAKQAVIQATGRNASDIHVFSLDMSDWQSVKAFTNEVSAKFPAIDIAVLNAGVASPKFVKNPKTGFEEALQVNVLSTAYLAILLMPKLKSTAAQTGTPSQLTLTGSFASKFVTATDVPSSENLLEKLNDPTKFDPAKAYGEIKLVTQYIRQGLTDDFSRDAEGAVDVYVNVACPGFCKTDLGRDFPWYMQIPSRLMQMYGARTAEEGGRALVSATVLGDVGHNKFWSNDSLDE